MQHRAATLAVTALLIAAAAGGTLAAPKIVVDQNVVDLGVVMRGDTAIATFTLRNEGDEPLNISRVRPTCGCTAVDYDDVIAPGGQGKVRLTFDNSNLEGLQTKKAFVYVDDPSVEFVELLFKADVKGSLYLRPTARARLSNRRPSLQSTEMLVQRDRTDEGVLTVSDLVVSDPWLKVEAVELTENYTVPGDDNIGRAGDWLLKFEYDGKPPFGWSETEVRFKTGMARQPEVSVGVRVENVPPVHLSEKQIELPRSGPASKTVMLSVRRELDPKKLRVESKARGVKLELVPSGPRHFRLQVDWDGTPIPEDQNIVFRYEGLRYPVLVRQVS